MIKQKIHDLNYRLVPDAVRLLMLSVVLSVLFVQSVAAQATPAPGNGEKVNEVLVLVVNVMTAIAGLLIVGSIIIAGLQYMTARDNASQVAAAKDRILVSVLSVFLLAFGFAILQWMIPGGIL